MNGNPFGDDELRQRGGVLFNHGPSSQAKSIQAENDWLGKDLESGCRDSLKMSPCGLD
jgi:hypothetical protein